MSNPPKYRARIRLTTEQMASITEQTGLAHVSDLLEFTIDGPADKTVIEHALDFDPAAEHGLIYERNRI